MSAGGDHLEAIRAHVERHFGPVTMVWHETVSDLDHLDVLVVEPSDDRPLWTLVTSGVSERAMTVPAGVATPRFAELVMHVAIGHPMRQDALQDERNNWPIRQLEQLARRSRESGTWLGPGQTIAGDPPRPVAPGVPFCAMAIVELLEPEVRRLRVGDDKEIAFYQVLALHPEELRARLAGELDLEEMFDDDVLRAIYNTRPPLLLDAAEIGAAYRRGQLLTRIAVVLLGVTIAGDATGCLADGAALPWFRIGFGAVLLALILGGSGFARWFGIAMAVVAAVAGGFELLGAGLPTWRHVATAASIPLWLLGAGLLWFGSVVGVWSAARKNDGGSDAKPWDG
ncbi:MAG: suppressor of fused domain protein [Planctomycetes bacterium]|nr:suppressor of fused domain protein [Planctomycetota bacterium]